MPLAVRFHQVLVAAARDPLGVGRCKGAPEICSRDRAQGQKKRPGPRGGGARSLLNGVFRFRPETAEELDRARDRAGAGAAVMEALACDVARMVTSLKVLRHLRLRLRYATAKREVL